MWSGIESSCSTICGNLPCFAPLLRKGHAFLTFVTRLGSCFNPRSSSRQYADRRLFRKRPSNETILDETYGAHMPFTQTTVQGGINSLERQDPEPGLPYIRVESSVLVANGV